MLAMKGSATVLVRIGIMVLVNQGSHVFEMRWLSVKHVALEIACIVEDEPFWWLWKSGDQCLKCRGCRLFLSHGKEAYAMMVMRTPHEKYPCVAIE